MKKTLVLALAALSCASISQAVEILRLPGSTDLTDANYWDGLVAPGSADVAVFDSTTVPDAGGVAYAGGNVYYGGFRFTDIQGPVSFGMVTYLDINPPFGITAQNPLADVSFSYLRNNKGGSFPITIDPGCTVRFTTFNSRLNAYTIPISGGGTMLVNGSADGGSTRMFYEVSGIGTTIGGNGTWKPSLVNTTYGMVIGFGCYIAPGDNGVGTMTIDGSGGATALSLADGSGMKFELGTGGAIALPSTDSDKLVLTAMSSNDVVFQGTTTIDCLGTGSEGVFKLIDTDGGTNTWSGLFLSGQEVVGGLVVTNLAAGLPAASLILGDGSTGDAGDIYLVIGSLTVPYAPTNLTWAAGDGVWDIDTTANWDNGSGASVYFEENGVGDHVAFDDTAAGSSPMTITLDTNVYPSSVTVDSTNDFILIGSGTMNGNFALTKAGSGTFTIGLTNTYAFNGGTTIGGGVVALESKTASLGTGAVTLTNGAQLTMYRGDTSDGGSSEIAVAFANELEVPAGQSGTVWSSPRGTWSGILTGTGTLNLRVNATRCEFSDDWSEFAGQINVTSRTGNDEYRIQRGYTSGLRLGAAKLNLADGVYMHQTAIPQSGAVGTVHEIGELSGTSGAIIGGSSIGGRYANWTVGALDTDSTFAGTIRDDIDQDNWGGYGQARLTKVGAGTLTLSGTNTYTGATDVNGGTLYISGSIVSNATVASGAAIGGSGSIAGNLTFDDGALFAFNPNDTLTVSGSLVFNNTTNTFGADDLVIASSNIVEATYNLIEGFTNSVTGLDTATYDIGGHSAYLHLNGNILQVVVGSGSIPNINSISVSGGFATLTWNSGTYNVYTNSSPSNAAGWGVATNAASPVSIPIGSQSKLFFRLGN